MEAARGVKTVGTIADENELHPAYLPTSVNGAWLKPALSAKAVR